MGVTRSEVGRQGDTLALSDGRGSTMEERRFWESTVRRGPPQSGRREGGPQIGVRNQERSGEWGVAAQE